MNFSSFWGKAHPFEGSPHPFHPLVWHSLDVAACADVILERLPFLTKNLLVRLGADEAELRLFIVRMAALHDIGKFSQGFQLKCPVLFPQFLSKPTFTPSGDHTAIGMRLMEKELAFLRGDLAPNVDAFAWPYLCAAVAGHHGRPVIASTQMPQEIGFDSIEAAKSFVAAILALFSGPGLSSPVGEERAAHFSWQLAGIMNLADWLGSNQSQFAYHPPGGSLEDYWRDIAVPRAIRSFETAGLVPRSISPLMGYRALTGEAYDPSPLQRHAEEMELSGGPNFFLVEDMTGAGKTEAALVLAHKLMKEGNGDGIFVALPTMATANSMYDRLSRLYRRLFAADEIPSLALAHGAARLHDGFQDSILEVGAEEQNYSRASRADDDVTASAACAAWIAADRRRTFFADVGVGTIDQAFLAVLPIKFAALRQLGLSRRVLILDEIHAYQAYESEELKTLIRFHAAAGGSIVALSATLPEKTKDKLIEAWCHGLGIRATRATWQDNYPLCTVIDNVGQVRCVPVAPRRDLPRTVEAERLTSVDSALDAIASAASAGACVAWVRNTVDDALTAAEALRQRGFFPIVFHSRFAMVDRLAIEAKIVKLFGRGSQSKERHGQIVVSTQVIEQSLDVDFDLLISDLAPIDLLIQRAGRLWRHQRAQRPVAVPRILVLSPEPLATAGENWIRAFLPGTSFVYENHALLWKTAAVLFTEGKIQSPSRIRPLVESVYAKNGLDQAPPGLHRRREQAEGKERGDAAIANMNLLTLRTGYTSSEIWGADISTPTRLGDERTVFRLARFQNGNLVPWAGEIAEAMTPREVERLWALSEVSLRSNLANGRGEYPQDIEQAACAVDAVWRAKGEQAILLPIIGTLDRICYLGSISSKSCGRREFEYSSKDGVVVRFL
jgi:CRISPR-associated endonuclease/helicase Cas3